VNEACTTQHTTWLQTCCWLTTVLVAAHVLAGAAAQVQCQTCMNTKQHARQQLAALYRAAASADARSRDCINSCVVACPPPTMRPLAGSTDAQCWAVQRGLSGPNAQAEPSQASAAACGPHSCCVCCCSSTDTACCSPHCAAQCADGAAGPNISFFIRSSTFRGSTHLA
jgi:hypothetical protein